MYKISIFEYIDFSVKYEKYSFLSAMLNTDLFGEIRSAKKKILVVTKYWDIPKTKAILKTCKDTYINEFFGLGENRIEDIKKKNIPREQVHFIGNIQSKKISDIAKYCSCIHSLSSLKHAEKFESTKEYIYAFVQVQIDSKKEIGIQESELADFLEHCESFSYLKIIGISAMGSGEYNESDKRKEFQKLLKIRDTHLSDGLISAGTSRDYKIALQEGIDVVRIGKKSIIIDN